MRDRHPRFLISALILCALHAAPARAYDDHDRWVTTAHGSAGAKGSPVTVTWSFAPNGTITPNGASNLINFLDTNFGAGPGGTDYTLRPWFTLFDQAFARISSLAGVTYVYESHDDGASFSSVTPGVLGVRGDERLGGASYPANQANTLATNFYPDYSEMTINTDQVAYLANAENNYRRLRNTLMHELMHGLGLAHIVSNDARFLLEPALGTSFDGPQLDDILGLQRLYGDIFEKNGGNDSAGLATALGAVGEGQSVVRGTLGNTTVVGGSEVDFLSIDDNGDVDYFSFTISQPLAVTLNLTPKGATYEIGPSSSSQTTLNAQALSDLSLALFNASGGLQIGATANANGIGFGESMIQELNPGTYLARATGANDNVQLYELRVSAAAIPPDQLVWQGLGGVWNVGATASFSKGGSVADVFRNGDQVTFANGAATNNVNVAGPVLPSAMIVNASSNYTFTGGGIVTNSLTVSGGGTATLANQGNAFDSIAVQSGRLRITGANNSSVTGAVRVASGATLELGGSQLFAVSATFSGAGSIEGNVIVPGTIAPGDSTGDATGMLTFADDLTLAGSSILSIELGGTQAGAEYDVVRVLGDIGLAGIANVTLVDNFHPGVGDSFSVLTWLGAFTGTTPTVNLPDIDGGLVWHTTRMDHELVLSVSTAATYAPADFNEDGFVNGDDLIAWQEGFPRDADATHQDGDANGDMIVDGNDFLTWQLGLPNPGGGTTAFSRGVPEPTAWLLTLPAAAFLAMRRRCGRSAC